MDPKNKVVLVTGGASGIGLAYAKELLTNGANVVICDVNTSAGEQALKGISQTFGQGRAIFVKADVTNEDEFEEVFKKAFSHFKRLDIVINNAGIFDDVNWEREIDVNVKGVIRGTLLGLKYLGKDHGRDGGLIVNIASILGLECVPQTPMYTATKHAVVGMSRCLGAPFHFTKTGVRIVTLCPSTTDTYMLQTSPGNCLSHDWSDEIRKIFTVLPISPPETVAKSLLRLVREAETGSVWVSEGDETYPVSIPGRQDIRKY